MQVQYTCSNQRETEVTRGKALTGFIADHIDKGRMERKAKVSASTVYMQQSMRNRSNCRKSTYLLHCRLHRSKQDGGKGKSKCKFSRYTAINVKQKTLYKEHLPASFVDHINQGRMEGKGKVSASSVYMQQLTRNRSNCRKSTYPLHCTSHQSRQDGGYGE